MPADIEVFIHGLLLALAEQGAIYTPDATRPKGKVESKRSGSNRIPIGETPTSLYPEPGANVSIVGQMTPYLGICKELVAVQSTSPINQHMGISAPAGSLPSYIHLDVVDTSTAPSVERRAAPPTDLIQIDTITTDGPMGRLLRLDG